MKPIKRYKHIGRMALNRFHARRVEALLRSFGTQRFNPSYFRAGTDPQKLDYRSQDWKNLL